MDEGVRPGGIRRAELAAFLRGRRSRLRPGEVGLPGGGRRRIPGLRRQEVAELAGMSVDYYIRLEQARGPRPSEQILAALARALMLTRDERDYLFRLAGVNPPQAASAARQLDPATRHLLDSLTGTPAYVLDARYDVLAWNQLAIPFIGDMSAVPEADRNVLRWMFRQSADDPRWSDEDTLAFARSSVADLRAAYGRVTGGSGSWSPSCSAAQPSSPRCGPSRRSWSAARCASRSCTQRPGHWSSTATCCTSRTPASGW
jgi:transcriptional regulator with XRE-family HTH domain